MVLSASRLGRETWCCVAPTQQLTWYTPSMRTSEAKQGEAAMTTPSRENMRLLLAARLSRKPKKDEVLALGIAIESQDKRAREWALANGHEVIDTAADYKSGTVAPWDRPQLRKWVTEPEKMVQYDGILAYKNDRLSRGAWDDEVRIRQWAEANNKILVIADGPQWPARHDGDFWGWTAMAKQARQEWEDIRRRSMEKQAELIAAHSLVGKPPWGYISVGTKYDKTIIPTDECRLYAPQIFERIASGDPVMRQAIAKGWSLAKVCRWLDSEDVKSVRGGKWSPKSLAQIIRNRTYIGQRQDASGRTVLECEPVVDALLWRRANKQLSDPRKGQRGPRDGEPALLTSVLFCDNCGSPMYRITSRSTHKDGSFNKHLYYRCAGRLPNRKGCGLMIDLDTLDVLASNMLASASAPWTELRLVAGSNHDAELEAVRLAMRDLAAKADDMTDEAYDSALTALRAERDHLRALPATADRVETITFTDETVGDHWTRLDRSGRRVMMRDTVKLHASMTDAGGTRVPVLRIESRLFTLPLVSLS